MSLESKAIPPQLSRHNHAEACSVQLHTVYTYYKRKFGVRLPARDAVYTFIRKAMTSV